MNYFDQKHDFSVIKDGREITFYHGYTLDSPEKHFLHINQCYEIYIFISGKADYMVENVSYPLQKGDIIVINPYQVHKVNLHCTDSYERFYFLVPVNAFEHLKINPLTLLKKKYSESNILRLSMDMKNIIINLLYKMSRFAQQDSETAELMFLGLFYEFLSRISYEKKDNNSGMLSESSNNIPQLIKNILDYIAMNFTDIKSVTELAEHFNISLPYLSSLFKKSTGTTIKSYIKMMKVAYAKELMDYGKDPTQACYDSGFDDYSHFIQVFKETTGSTPGQYRKEIKINNN